MCSTNNMGPVLVTGGTGMLGRSWAALLESGGIDHVVTTREQFDLSRPDMIDDVIGERFTHVINCAAWTDVDGAESDPDGANLANGTTVGALARRCAQTDAMLVHYSTDYVFNGQACEPYTVDAPHDPINVYGQSKSLGERLIAESGCSHLLIRTSWVYAPWGRNFVLTIAGAARQRERLQVVDDQLGRPTSTEHLADATQRLIQARAAGVYHVTDGGQCTWFDFATHIAGAVNPACRVEPCSSNAFVRPAPRPAYSVLDISTAQALVGPMPPWEANVDAVLAGIDA